MPTEGDKYGLKLHDFLRLGRFDLSRRVPPSRNEIQHAIYSLANPQEVTYETFETILALEWSPTCVNIDLLVSNIRVGVFPACIGVLQYYCQTERRGILDDSFGFLGLQVMTLAVEVAKLYRSDQHEQFFSKISQLPPNQSILEPLHMYIHITFVTFQQGLASRSGGDLSLFHQQLLGWRADPNTGQDVCLSEIGGCTLANVKFLLGRLWTARKKFLYAAEYAATLCPGWCGLVCLFQDALMQNFRFMASGTPTSEQERCWIHFCDLMCRYSLCAGEDDDPILACLVAPLPNFIKPFYKSTGTAVDALDSERMVAAYMKKFNSYERRLPPNAFMSMLFAYMFTNLGLERATYENDLSQMVEATVGRGWMRLSDAQDMSIGEWEVFSFSIMDIPSIFTEMFVSNKRLPMTKLPGIVAVASSECLVEFLARLILFPLSSSGGTILGYLYLDPGLAERLQKAMNVFSGALRIRMKEAHFNPSEAFISVWNKTLQYLAFRSVMSVGGTQRGRDYARAWGPLWARFQIGGPGRKVGGYPYFYHLSLPPLHCDYVRCAAPETLAIWECSGCNTKRYCSQRCQQADWLHPAEPHNVRCKIFLEEADRAGLSVRH